MYQYDPVSTNVINAVSNLFSYEEQEKLKLREVGNIAFKTQIFLFCEAMNPIYSKEESVKIAKEIKDSLYENKKPREKINFRLLSALREALFVAPDTPPNLSLLEAVDAIIATLEKHQELKVLQNIDIYALEETIIATYSGRIPSFKKREGLNIAILALLAEAKKPLSNFEFLQLIKKIFIRDIHRKQAPKQSIQKEISRKPEKKRKKPGFWEELFEWLIHKLFRDI